MYFRPEFHRNVRVRHLVQQQCEEEENRCRSGERVADERTHRDSTQAQRNAIFGGRKGRKSPDNPDQDEQESEVQSYWDSDEGPDLN